MIRSFRNRGTEDLFYGRHTKAARSICPQSIRRIATRKLELLDSANALVDLRIPPGNRLEALSGNRKGQHSMRINEQFRICFVWTNEGPTEVEVTDYH